MGTNQALTTAQVTVLTMLYELEDYLDTKIEDFEWKSIKLDLQTVYEYVDILQYYGYVDSDNVLTLDGKQYLYLLSEYVEKKVENPTVVLNTSFTLINIEKLGLNIDILSGTGDVIEGTKKIGKLLIAGIRKLKSKEQ